MVSHKQNSLMDFKMNFPHVNDPTLRGLYAEAIKGFEMNLKELLPYFQLAPVPTRNASPEDLTAFFAAHLLICAKTSVRNYAIAIAETATPSLRATLTKQLVKMIQLHSKVFYFMLERGLYPSYNLEQLLANDAKNAQMAIQM
ncbi:spore coat protein [Cohnella luojiensis]|uniref:Spore coat protein n=2 Tax=Cohnella luojiensis TaxID=652876 RepID=A0A4Y8M7D9_9BACL|nr:spore coat protein [Cohnella luojiensis]